MRAAPETLARKAEAQRYLTLVRSQIARGEWTDPERARVTLGDYPSVDRGAGRAAVAHDRALRLAVAAAHHAVRWGSAREARHAARARVARQAADRGRVGVNCGEGVPVVAVGTDDGGQRGPDHPPQPVPGARGGQGAPDRAPVLTAAEVVGLAEAVPARYRAMILLTTFASLRFGEVTALQRSDLDLRGGTVSVRRQYVEVRGEGLVPGPPKSVAGPRTVSIPPSVVEAMRGHLDEHVEDDPAALVFTGPKGGPIRRGNFRKLTLWRKVVADLGLVGRRSTTCAIPGTGWRRAAV
jgi:integrase